MTNPPQPTRFWTSDRVVIWLSVLAAMVLNAVAVWLTTPGGIDSEYSIPIGLGMLCGEVCVVAIVSGLTGQTWLTGYFRGLVMMVLGYLGLIAGACLIDRLRDLEPLSMMCVLPWLLLIITSPVFLLRQFGWRLIRKDWTPPPSFPFRIADLLHGTAMVAATLALVRVPEVFEEVEPRDFWFPLLIVAGSLFAMCLIAVPIATRLGFGTGSRWKAAIGLGLLAIAASFIIILVTQCFYDWGTSWETRMEVIQPTAMVVGAAIAVLYPFLFFYSRSGIVLVRRRRGHTTSEIGNPSTTADLTQERSIPRSRWKIAAVVAVAILTNIGLAQLQTWRRARDLEIVELTALARKVNSVVNANDRQILSLYFYEPATDSHFEQFADRQSCHSLRFLEISSPRMTNRSLEIAANFPLLESLTVKSAEITDDALAQLSKLKNLTTLQLTDVTVSDRGLIHLSDLNQLCALDLIGTSVTAVGLAPIADNNPIASLNLDNTRFTDADCAVLARMKSLQFLSLKRTAVTDGGLRQLENLGQLISVDLSHTAVTGAGLSGSLAIRSLNIDDTRANDESIQALATLTKLTDLHLSGTEITGASLERLAPLPDLGRLDISNNNLTDQVVARLAACPNFRSMTINLSQNPITGEGFRNWPPSPNLYLVLNDTQLSDSTLPLIAKTGLHGLTVCGTTVTCNGLIAAGFTGLKNLRIGKGQFSDAEIMQLERRFGAIVEVDDESDEK